MQRWTKLVIRHFRCPSFMLHGLQWKTFHGNHFMEFPSKIFHEIPWSFYMFIADMELLWKMSCFMAIPCSILHGTPRSLHGVSPSGLAMENVFWGDSMGFHVKFSIEFSWKTFSMVFSSGQKHKNSMGPVAFHGNSVEYYTWNSMESS